MKKILIVIFAMASTVVVMAQHKCCNDSLSYKFHKGSVATDSFLY